jgi:Cupin superfamily protein
MHNRAYNLGSLLHPVSLDTFFSTYWEKQLLRVQRGDGGYYDGLLTNRNLEDYISSADARYPAIMLAKEGAFYPPQAYCDDVKMGHVTFAGVPNLKKLSAEYARGATIALTSLDRTWQPLGDLCMRLEDQLDHGIKTNIYITAGQTVGFPPHYDTHDILVLQIAGKKLWRIYAPTIKLPDVSQPCEPRSFRPGAQITEIELQTGDLLYLPRGYGHAATTSESHSAHITVGIHVYTWATVLKELDPSCVATEECRRALPPGFASRVDLRPTMKEHLKRMTGGRLADSNLDRLLDAAIRHVNQIRRRPPARFRADTVVISESSRLSTPPSHRYQLVGPIDGQGKAPPTLTLEFDGNKYSFPAQLDAVLKAMCSRDSFILKELPGSLNGEAMLGLAGYLQSIGFLTAAT